MNAITKIPFAARPPYVTPDRAYSHLLPFLDRAPNLPRARHEAFVTLFVSKCEHNPETLTHVSFRLWESFESILQYHNSSVFRTNVVVSLDHLRLKYTRAQCRKIYRCYHNNEQRLPKDKDADVHEMLWRFLHGDNTNFVRIRRAMKHRGSNNYVFNLDRIAEKLADPDFKIQKQARQIMTFIMEDGLASYTIDELEKASITYLRRGLKTKSNPFRILQYYLPKLNDLGLVEYPRKKFNRDED